MKIRKAIIPAAGLGTRMLPATKTVPKEILPLADRPAIQYLIEEAVASGVENIIVITSRSKTAIEDYFDYAPELEAHLRKVGQTEAAEHLRATADIANIICVRQKEMRGLGHAILSAAPYIGDEPFAVLLGDDIISAPRPVTAQLADVWDRYGGCVVGVQEVAPENICKYGSVRIAPLEDRVFAVDDIIEKPGPGEAYSNYAVLGRYILPPEIFDVLRCAQPGRGGEIQLTDSIRALCGKTPVSAVDFEGRRFDTGSLRGYLEAQIEISLENPEVGQWLRAWLKERAKTL